MPLYNLIKITYYYFLFKKTIKKKKDVIEIQEKLITLLRLLIKMSIDTKTDVIKMIMDNNQDMMLYYRGKDDGLTIAIREIENLLDKYKN